MNPNVRYRITAVLLGLILLPTSTRGQFVSPEAISVATRAQETLGWRVGIAARSFRHRSFFEAVALTASLGQKHIEGFSEQKVSTDIPKSLDYNLSEAERKAVTEKLRSSGMTMRTFAVDPMPLDEESCSRVFEFARALGVETIVCKLPPESLSMIEQFCDKYSLNVAIHPQVTDASAAYPDPDGILKLFQGRSKRVGLCGDLGQWMRAGVKPVEAVRALKDRLLTLHVHDLSQFGSEGRDVPWGTGVADLEEFIQEVYRLELKPTLWTVEYSAEREEVSAEIARSLEFFNKIIVPIADYHRNYAARTKGVRRLAGVSPEEHQKIERALPRRAPAVPAKPRKLLVIDLNVGRHGHPSIPHANLAVELMGKKTGAYEAVFSNDPSMLQRDNLRQFDAVFLNNTIGPIFNTPELRASFRAFLSNGGGLVANHAVTVTSEDWPEFGEILGARGASHRDADEKVIVKLEDPDSPLNAAFGGRSFAYSDEIFRFGAPYSRDKVHVLLSIDVDRTDMNQGRPRGNCLREDNDYAISWIRQYGRGRVFYCSLGHNPYVFWDRKMLEHFLAGIQFALGDLEADATPAFRAATTDDRLDVWADGQLVTSYKFRPTQKYPYFWPVNGPLSGRSVTTQTSEPYPHHHSLFFGCDRVNGANYWQEDNARGQIVSTGPKLLVDSGTYVLFTDRCLWKQPDKEPVFEDSRCFLIHAPGKTLRVIDASFRLKALTDVQILRTNHALFSARMVPELSVTSGGTLINAEGKTREKGTFGEPSAWCDYCGSREGVTEGLSILQAPSNPCYPFPWFTRDYGFFSPTPMWWLDDGRLDIPKGKVITLTYRVLIHGGDVEAASVAELFAQYASVFTDTKVPPSVHDLVEKGPGAIKPLRRFLDSARRTVQPSR